MLNLGPLELMAIFVVALIVFGPNKLPEIGRQVGRAIKEFRRIQSTFQSEFSDVLNDPPPGPVVPGPTAAPAAPREFDPGDEAPAGTSPEPASNGSAPDASSPPSGDDGTPGTPPDTASR